MRVSAILLILYQNRKILKVHPLRKNIEEVIELTDEEFEYVLSHFEPCSIKKGGVLVSERSRVDNDWFVLSGYLEAYEIDKTDKKRIIQLATKNWWISDYWAYMNQKPATLYIDCIADAEMFSISLKNRLKLCSEMHKIEHFYNVKANNGYIELQQRILSLLGDTAKEKLPKSLIASYLGVSRETLSRLY